MANIFIPKEPESNSNSVLSADKNQSERSRREKRGNGTVSDSFFEIYKSNQRLNEQKKILTGLTNSINDLTKEIRKNNNAVNSSKPNTLYNSISNLPQNKKNTGKDSYDNLNTKLDTFGKNTNTLISEFKMAARSIKNSTENAGRFFMTAAKKSAVAAPKAALRVGGSAARKFQQSEYSQQFDQDFQDTKKSIGNNVIRSVLGVNPVLAYILSGMGSKGINISKQLISSLSEMKRNRRSSMSDNEPVLIRHGGGTVVTKNRKRRLAKDERFAVLKEGETVLPTQNVDFYDKISTAVSEGVLRGKDLEIKKSYSKTMNENILTKLTEIENIEKVRSKMGRTKPVFYSSELDYFDDMSKTLSGAMEDWQLGKSGKKGKPASTRLVFSNIVPIFGSQYRAELPRAQRLGILGGMYKLLSMIYVQNRYSGEELSERIMEQSKLQMEAFGVKGSLKKPKAAGFLQWYGKQYREMLHTIFVKPIFGKKEFKRDIPLIAGLPGAIGPGIDPSIMMMAGSAGGGKASSIGRFSKSRLHSKRKTEIEEEMDKQVESKSEFGFESWIPKKVKEKVSSVSKEVSKKILGYYSEGQKLVDERTQRIKKVRKWKMKNKFNKVKSSVGSFAGEGLDYLIEHDPTKNIREKYSKDRDRFHKKVSKISSNIYNKASNIAFPPTHIAQKSVSKAKDKSSYNEKMISKYRKIFEDIKSRKHGGGEHEFDSQNSLLSNLREEILNEFKTSGAHNFKYSTVTDTNAKKLLDDLSDFRLENIKNKYGIANKLYKAKNVKSKQIGTIGQKLKSIETRVAIGINHRKYGVKFPFNPNKNFSGIPILGGKQEQDNTSPSGIFSGKNTSSSFGVSKNLETTINKILTSLTSYFNDSKKYHGEVLQNFRTIYDIYLDGINNAIKEIISTTRKLLDKIDNISHSKQSGNQDPIMKKLLEEQQNTTKAIEKLTTNQDKTNKYLAVVNKNIQKQSQVVSGTTKQSIWDKLFGDKKEKSYAKARNNDPMAAFKKKAFLSALIPIMMSGATYGLTGSVKKTLRSGGLAMIGGIAGLVLGMPGGLPGMTLGFAAGSGIGGLMGALKPEKVKFSDMVKNLIPYQHFGKKSLYTSLITGTLGLYLGGVRGLAIGASVGSFLGAHLEKALSENPELDASVSKYYNIGKKTLIDNKESTIATSILGGLLGFVLGGARGAMVGSALSSVITPFISEQVKGISIGNTTIGKLFKDGYKYSSPEDMKMTAKSSGVGSILGTLLGLYMGGGNIKAAMVGSMLGASAGPFIGQLATEGKPGFGFLSSLFKDGGGKDRFGVTGGDYEGGTYGTIAGSILGLILGMGLKTPTGMIRSISLGGMIGGLMGSGIQTKAPNLVNFFGKSMSLPNLKDAGLIGGISGGILGGILGSFGGLSGITKGMSMGAYAGGLILPMLKEKAKEKFGEDRVNKYFENLTSNYTRVGAAEDSLMGAIIGGVFGLALPIPGLGLAGRLRTGMAMSALGSSIFPQIMGKKSDGSDSKLKPIIKFLEESYMGTNNGDPAYASMAEGALFGGILGGVITSKAGGSGNRLKAFLPGAFLGAKIGAIAGPPLMELFENVQEKTGNIPVIGTIVKFINQTYLADGAMLKTAGSSIVGGLMGGIIASYAGTTAAFVPGMKLGGIIGATVGPPLIDLIMGTTQKKPETLPGKIGKFIKDFLVGEDNSKIGTNLLYDLTGGIIGAMLGSALGPAGAIAGFGLGSTLVGPFIRWSSDKFRKYFYGEGEAISTLKKNSFTKEEIKGLNKKDDSKIQVYRKTLSAQGLSLDEINQKTIQYQKELLKDPNANPKGGPSLYDYRMMDSGSSMIKKPKSTFEDSFKSANNPLSSRFSNKSSSPSTSDFYNLKSETPKKDKEMSLFDTISGVAKGTYSSISGGVKNTVDNVKAGFLETFGNSSGLWNKFSEIYNQIKGAGSTLANNVASSAGTIYNSVSSTGSNFYKGKIQPAYNSLFNTKPGSKEYWESVKNWMKQSEGFRPNKYYDVDGYSIGYGHHFPKGTQPMDKISMEEANKLFDEDFRKAWSGAMSFPEFPKLDPHRQAAIIDMVYNMGVGGVSKFKDMWSYIQNKDWQNASKSILNSSYASQVKDRATTNAQLIYSGYQSIKDGGKSVLDSIVDKGSQLYTSAKNTLMPTSGVITSKFGMRQLPGEVPRQHTGIDIAGTQSTPVYASDEGMITFAGYTKSGGQSIQIEHTNGLISYYHHLKDNSMMVHPGQYVNKGTQLGLQGNTGHVSGKTGVHLHFGVKDSKTGEWLDPESVLGPLAKNSKVNTGTAPMGLVLDSDIKQMQKSSNKLLKEANPISQKNNLAERYAQAELSKNDYMSNKTGQALQDLGENIDKSSMASAKSIINANKIYTITTNNAITNAMNNANKQQTNQKDEMDDLAAFLIRGYDFNFA